MLERANICPSVLSSVPQGEYAQKLYFNNVLGLMRDILETGLVVTDDGGKVLDEYKRAIPIWPQKFRKPLQEILVAMVKKHRFIHSRTAAIPKTPGEPEKCPCVDISSAGVYSLFAQSCTDCAKQAYDDPVTRSEIAEYCLTSLKERLRERASLITGDGTLDQPTFETTVLIPLLKDAKHLKIYDRYIGRTVKTKDHKGRLLTGVTLPARYSETLSWIISVFLHHSRRTTARLVEIYGGVDRRSHLEVREVKSAFARFARDFAARHSFPITMTLKEEQSFASMVHARYIITDQAIVFLDRGMDLLWSDDQMRQAGLDPNTSPRRVRDVAIATCRDASPVLNCVAGLRDA